MDKIFDTIKKSYDILDMPDDWDDDGADKAIPEAFNKAMLFLHLMIVKIGFSLPIPEIDLSRDGSIDISFREEEYRFLINFKTEKSACYGDNGHDGDVIKTSGDDLKTDEIVDWFKKHLLKP